VIFCTSINLKKKILHLRLGYPVISYTTPWFVNLDFKNNIFEYRDSNYNSGSIQLFDKHF